MDLFKLGATLICVSLRLSLSAAAKRIAQVRPCSSNRYFTVSLRSAYLIHSILLVRRDLSWGPRVVRWLRCLSGQSPKGHVHLPI